MYWFSWVLQKNIHGSDSSTGVWDQVCLHPSVLLLPWRVLPLGQPALHLRGASSLTSPVPWQQHANRPWNQPWHQTLQTTATSYLTYDVVQQNICHLSNVKSVLFSPRPLHRPASVNAPTAGNRFGNLVAGRPIHQSELCSTWDSTFSSGCMYKLQPYVRPLRMLFGILLLSIFKAIVCDNLCIKSFLYWKCCGAVALKIYSYIIVYSGI